MSPAISTQALLPLVGHRVEFLGRVYVVVEVLDAAWSLVLESPEVGESPDIQTDSLGYAHRLSPHQEVVKVLNEHGQIDLPAAGIRLL